MNLEFASNKIDFFTILKVRKPTLRMSLEMSLDLKGSENSKSDFGANTLCDTLNFLNLAETQGVTDNKSKTQELLVFKETDFSALGLSTSPQLDEVISLNEFIDMHRSDKENYNKTVYNKNKEIVHTNGICKFGDTFYKWYVDNYDEIIRRHIVVSSQIKKGSIVQIHLDVDKMEKCEEKVEIDDVVDAFLTVIKNSYDVGEAEIDCVQSRNAKNIEQTLNKFHIHSNVYDTVEGLNYIRRMVIDELIYGYRYRMPRM